MWTKEQKREYNKNWRKEHPNYSKDYRNSHKEQINETRRNWRKRNPEDWKKYSYTKEERQQYYHNHREQIIKSTGDWAKNHREQVNMIMRNYYRTHKKDRERRKKHFEEWSKNHPKEMREFYKKHTHKRRRNLGFVPFNQLFNGAVAHHIDFECVVYIPEQLHKSVYHNIHTGQGMAEINDKVFEWLIEHGVS